jgi:5-methylcytosine-specific restriction endonuclease McrA
MDAAMRARVWERAGHRCEYCRIHQEDEPFYRLHVEHIGARQHGGADDADNLALACHHDNEHKGPISPGSIPRPGTSCASFTPAASAGPATSSLTGR